MQTFTTEQLPVNERIAWWIEVVCDHVLDLSANIELSGVDRQSFNGELVKEDIGNLNLLRASRQGG